MEDAPGTGVWESQILPHGLSLSKKCRLNQEKKRGSPVVLDLPPINISSRLSSEQVAVSTNSALLYRTDDWSISDDEVARRSRAVLLTVCSGSGGLRCNACLRGL